MSQDTDDTPTGGNHSQNQNKSADSGAPLQGAKLLVIEDDPDVQDLVVRMLESLDYTVMTASTCAAAVDVLRAQEVDLVLSDVVLPDGISGQAFLDQVHAMQPGVKVIFMSGYPAPVAETQAPMNPNGVLLTKPFRRQELADAVAAALAS